MGVRFALNMDSLPDPAERQATVIGGYALAIAKALDASGIDSARILKSAGVAPGMSNDPMSRLPVETLTRLYQACVAVTNNPYFGLTVARFLRITNLHALGYALAASGNLMDFCVRLQRFFRLVSQSSDVEIVESGNEVALNMRLLVKVSPETEDAFLGFLVLTMRQMYAPYFNPLRVDFSHAMPRDGVAPYEALFKSPVRFDQPSPALVLPRDILQLPLPGACAELAQLNDNIATRYIARLDKDDVVTAVRQKIIEYLPNGDCTREKVAAAMNVTPATLQNRLARRDTNFHDLLDSIRKELAVSYVRQASLSMTEITFLLGFGDLTNFTRAFKRWEGMSPSDFRNRPG